jgi:hypothetical protein
MLRKMLIFPVLLVAGKVDKQTDLINVINRRQVCDPSLDVVVHLNLG